MKIGIAGTHSTGKTTLLNALRSEGGFEDYKICDGVTRWVKDLGLEINKDGGDEAQRLILMKHLYNMTMYDKMIADRTILDVFCYTTSQHRNDKISDELFLEAESLFNKIIDKYDYIFYIEPEFDIVDDGVRSTDAEWQKEIQDIFEEVIKEYDIKVLKVSGSVRNRVDNILRVLDD